MQDKTRGYDKEYEYERRNLEFIQKQVESKKNTVSINIQNIGQKEEDIKQMKYKNLETVQKMQEIEKQIQINVQKIKSLDN